MRRVAGIDVGGTFTDLLLLETGGKGGDRVRLAKVPTTVANQAQVDYDNDEDNLAWGGLVGVDSAFAPDWSAELAYRYIDLGDVDTGAAPTTGETISGDSYVSHDVLLSVIYRF